MRETRTEEQETQAQELVAAIAEVSEEELLEIACTLVDAEPADCDVRALYRSEKGSEQRSGNVSSLPDHLFTN